ncbi:glutamic acid-rich protein-like isoform X2 [Nilaparvata lugens]|uniref:glutamic acid-rich protein-like isoform X2 n=1 Tax=Nilaparvata lugens TaxID=108931 RepID=UPI00193D10AA|nr:glutamic acid-rich protein-like isoform X2 [Nilaparvata lugens]
MEMRKHFSETDLPVNTKISINAKRRILSIRNNPTTTDSQITKIVSSQAAGDLKISDSLVRKQKQIEKVEEDFASASETTVLSSLKTSGSDITIRNDTSKTGDDRKSDYANNNVINASISEEEDDDEKDEEEDEDDDEEEEEEEEEVEEEVKKKEMIRIEQKKVHNVNKYEDRKTNHKKVDTYKEEFQILETILSSAVIWIHFFVVIVWIITVTSWYVLPLMGVEDTFIDKLMTTQDEIE